MGYKPFCPNCNQLKELGWVRRLCRPCEREYTRSRYYANTEKHLAYQRKNRYGISVLETHELMMDQDNKCAICSAALSWRTANVDHNHKNGGVRGLLCSNCNKGLGCFNDDPEIIRRAIEYLNKHKEVVSL